MPTSVLLVVSFLNFIIVCIMLEWCMYVEVRQFCEVLYFHLYTGSGVGIQIVRVAQPLSTEPFY